MPSPGLGVVEADTLEAALAPRLGPGQLRRRLAMEAEHEARAARRGGASSARLVGAGLWMLGLRARSRRDALAIAVRRHEARLARLAPAFDGSTILQLSDLHLGIVPGLLEVLLERLRDLRFDLSVLTGDYRGRTHGSCDAALAALERLRPHLSA
jgi:uncharacterized protein